MIYISCYFSIFPAIQRKDVFRDKSNRLYYWELTNKDDFLYAGALPIVSHAVTFHRLYIYIYIYLYIYVSVCLCVCVCLCVYVHTHTHTHTHTYIYI